MVLMPHWLETAFLSLPTEVSHTSSTRGSYNVYRQGPFILTTATPIKTRRKAGATKEGEEIHYELAFYRETPFSVRNYGDEMEEK